MTFISLNYALFLIIVLLLYWLIPKKNWRLFILLIASIAFYSTFQPFYIPLLILSILFNFYLSQEINENLHWRGSKIVSNSRPLLLLWFGIIVNILLLLSFKYIPFIFNSIGTLTDLPSLIKGSNWIEKNVVPPLGLSFFCFESIAYLIDIYRGAPVSKSLREFTTYKLFFPKLISGPITRYHYWINQWSNPQKYQQNSRKNTETILPLFPTAEQLTEGSWRIAIGALKKSLLADNLGIFVGLSFNNLQRAGSGDLWLAIIAYGLQLYLDFSAYVDIACGTALLLGLKLPENFDFPYFTTSIADFWRRWHITLGDCLRNYLYFPLGGSRVGLFRTCLNLLIVMLIAGIWHGAAWGFIIWGLLHGLALVIHRLTDKITTYLQAEKIWQNPAIVIFSWLITQGSVFLFWVYFRLPQIGEANWVFSHLFGHNGDVQFAHKVYIEALGLERINLTFLIGLLIIGMILMFWLQKRLKLQLNWPLKLILSPIFLFLVFLFAPEGALPYIYFDF